MTNIIHIEEAYNDVVSAYEQFDELNRDYIALMSGAHGYRIVSDDVQQVKAVTGAIGYVHNATFYNERGALTAGLIEKITAVKPDELKEAEKVLQGATIAYNNVCSEMIAKFQFKATKTRSSSGVPGNSGATKNAEVIAQIRAVDPSAVLNFEGRRVYGTLSNGVQIRNNRGELGVDVYGVAFQDGVPQCILNALKTA